MKKMLAGLSYVLLAVMGAIQAQVKLPATSPAQTIRQEFGLGTIEVNYPRPAAKGRRVFGDLVPYGKLWRPGTSGFTRLTFSDPVEMNGRRLDSGSYVLYTIPGEESWEVIINKGVKNAAAELYRESEDVIRFKLEPLRLKSRTESFTIQFAAVKPESCELQLTWEKRGITIPLTTNIKERLRAQIDAAMLGEKKPYWQAAQFYNEYDHNLNKALENVNKATETNPKAFWMFLYKARIQKEAADFNGAMETSKIAMALAKDAKNEDYIRMNEKLQKELKKDISRH
jgi:hypothetical protein